MMKRYNIFRKNAFSSIVLAIIVSVVASGCFYLDSISVTQFIDGEEKAEAYANTEATFVVKGHVEAAGDISSTQLVIAFLAPKGWAVAQNAKVTYCCDLAEDAEELHTMALIPSTTLPKNGDGRTWVECLTQTYGVGPNVLDDMEWVVWQSPETYTVNNGNRSKFTAYITTNVGKQNLKCYLGFFINHTDDGFSGGTDHKKYSFSERFEVKGGEGEVLDFCNKHYNRVSPMQSLQDDFITFTFNGRAAENTLAGNNVYLQGEAVTTEGHTYKCSGLDATTLMRLVDKDAMTYNLTVWPLGFFNVPEEEDIDYINYYFTDGNVKIGLSDDNFEQYGIERPAEMTPFSFVLTCPGK